MEEIKKLEEELKDAEFKLDSSKITATRGRLIKKIKQELSKLKKAQSNPEQIQELEELLSKTLEDHKDQLSGRYKQEFVKKSGSFASIITALPKGIALAARKVATCVSQVKESKTNKERAHNIVETLKSAGLLTTTPLIFTGKFMTKHWFLTLMFVAYIFNIPGILFNKAKDTIVKNGENALLDNKVGQKAAELFGKEVPEKTTFGEELKKTFTDKEQLKEIGRGGIERIKHLPTTIKNDAEAVKKAYQFIRDNFRTINYLIKKKFNIDISQINDETKTKLNGLKERFEQFTPNGANSAQELNSINNGLEEIKASIINGTALITSKAL
jgi:uncharacterized protein with HEPN domain